MNKNLHRAKKAKNDEFYTLREDIHDEVINYKEQLEDKVIYMNCDNITSNFWKYFVDNFHKYKLKKIIRTSITNSDRANKLIYDGSHFKWINLKGNGDFRSPEAIETLKEADVIITNPPFSLFREYIDLMAAYNKDFLIIGNFNAVTYKDIFPLIKDNKIWLGYTAPKEFVQPDGTIKKVNVCWFTNMGVKKRYEDIKLHQTYKGNKDKYPKYDNYDAININRIKDIPKDYKGVMGVPITFLTQYNPKQFKIIKFRKGNNNKDLMVNGKTPYFRILIQNLNPEIKEEE